MIVYRLNGKTVTKEEFRKGNRGIDFNGGCVRTQLSTTWPQHSDAMGVHESQRAEAYAESVRAGVPTYFDNQGRAVFNSAGHRKRYCETLGYFDRNAGYSDPKPKNI